ncbi:transglycosylase SLT domain-containing protein [Streptomyces sp. NPDC004330]|uniref:transglycosylase SLT domain-containing protein n=1 Tax=Streptomyces sp. NPDC004330 TaxID=3364700 RepID=UPI003683A7E9
MPAAGVLVGRGYVSIRPEFEGDWSRQASARASRAGRSGGSAFAKGFGTALKGVGALAGVAIASNLAAVGASAAVLAPALVTAGAAAASLKIGLSGVGDAFKAAFADTKAQASQAASATKAVESAQRGLANAQRALADARVQAAQRIADAQDEVVDAERDLADAQQDALATQQELTGARQDAVRTLEDMNQRLAESRLEEKEAVLRLKEAEDELRTGRRKKGVTPDELARLALAYERAKLNLQDQRRETQRLQTDTEKANQAGVEGSEQVLAVKKRIAAADETVAERERALTEAREGVDEARADGARQVADAQRAVADAMAAVADAQKAGASQTDKFAEAMAKLAPNARSFVNTIRGLAPAWREVKLGVQERLFAGLDSTVSNLSSRTLPILRRQLQGGADGWNAMAKSTAAAISQMAKSGVLEKMLAGANRNLMLLKTFPGDFLSLLGTLSVAAQPAFEKMTAAFAQSLSSLDKKATAGLASGGLETAITTAMNLLGQFLKILGDALGAVGNIMKAAADAGGQALAVVGELFAELRRVTALPEVQAALRTIFASVAQIAAAIAPIFGAALQALLPLLAAIAPVFAELAKTLGPVLVKVVQALGSALTPLIKALLPIVTLVGDALIQMVAALTPLLAPIARLLSSIIEALMPALEPVVDLITKVVDALAGPLIQAVQACMPIITLLGDLITQVFGALEPLIQPLITVVTQVATLLITVLSTALDQVMEAIGPIIPMFVDLVTAMVAGLIPILPVLTDLLTVVVDLFLEIGVSLIEQLLPPLLEMSLALTDLVVALLPILPPLTTLIALVLKVGAAVLSWLLPPLVQLVGYLVGKFANAMSGTIRWLTDVVKWIREKAGSAFKWLNEKVVQPAARGIKTALGWLADASDLASKAFDVAVDAIGKKWSDLKKLAMDPIRFVIDSVYNEAIVGLWNKIAGSFGGPKLDPWHPRIPGFAGGGVAAEGIRPGYTPGRDNALIAVGGGEAIMRPEWTRAIGADRINSWNAAARSGGVAGVQKALGLPGYADGGIVGWVKNAAGMVGDLLTDPSKVWAKMTAPIRKMLEGMGDSPWVKLGARIPGKLLSTLKDKIVDAAGNLFGGGDSGGGSAPTGNGGSGVQRWRGTVLQALSMVGQPAAYADITLRRMNQESGGNPNIVNKWDSNWLAGHPSVGLMQVIGPTFDAYAGQMRGVGPKLYGVSVNPLANVYASMRYALSRYRSLPSAYNRPGGYDAGGLLQPGWTQVYNGLGSPEYILTPSQWRAMSGAAAAGMQSGLQAGDELALIVKDEEFTAYVDYRASRQITSTLAPAIAAARAGRKG